MPEDLVKEVAQGAELGHRGVVAGVRRVQPSVLEQARDRCAGERAPEGRPRVDVEDVVVEHQIQALALLRNPPRRADPGDHLQIEPDTRAALPHRAGDLGRLRRLGGIGRCRGEQDYTEN